MNNSIVWGVGGLLIGVLVGAYLSPGMMPFRYSMMGGQNLMGNQGMRGGGQMMNIDARFIENMIPHHEGAIEMAEIALQRSKRSEIKSLAQGIIEAQTREIADMKRWYQDWYGEAPVSGSGMMMGGMMGMHGMEGDTDELRSVPDAQFDVEFIEQMIVHHEMAIMMASMLEAGTARSEMRELADQIITSQSREIEMMQSWYRDWSAGN